MKVSNHKISLTLGWLYPELMSTYGDRGNVLCLQKRALWRGFYVKIVPIEVESAVSDVEGTDLVIGGGAQDRQQEIVMRDLRGEKGKILKKLIENNVPGLFTCGSPQLLGHYYEPTYGNRIEGLGIFDMVSISPKVGTPRCIGNMVMKVNLNHSLNEARSSRPAQRDSSNNLLVGFENHGGRTYLGKNVKPLGLVIRGFGNNGEDQTEGAVYKNAIATYLHGPVLPKNPFLADYLLTLALEKKYGKKIELKAMDDSLEIKAHDQMIKKIVK